MHTCSFQISGSGPAASCEGFIARVRALAADCGITITNAPDPAGGQMPPDLARLSSEPATARRMQATLSAMTPAMRAHCLADGTFTETALSPFEQLAIADRVNKAVALTPVR